MIKTMPAFIPKAKPAPSTEKEKDFDSPLLEELRHPEWRTYGPNELHRVIQDLAGDPRTGFLAGFEIRHKEEQHRGTFEACREQWCAHVHQALESRDEYDVFVSYETRHQTEAHPLAFDQCTDRWCKYFRDLLHAVENFSN